MSTKNYICLFTVEAEYSTFGSYFTQLPWMKHMLVGYGMFSNPLLIYCDNMCGKYIYKNPVQHSITKHITIKHHFVIDLVEEKIVETEYVSSEKQFTDIFAEALACFIY